jgi:hypothetical protein
MTKSREEQEQEQAQDRAIQAAKIKAQQQEQQQQQQQSPKQATTTTTTTLAGNVPQQTIGNVSPAQAQANLQEQNTIQQNIDGDIQANKTNDDLKLLKRLVGNASPIVENQEETKEQKDSEGATVQVPVTKKVTTGYTYYAVQGKPFEEWVQEAFGGDVTVDTKENKITYNKPIEEIQSKEVNFNKKEENNK